MTKKPRTQATAPLSASEAKMHEQASRVLRGEVHVRVRHVHAKDLIYYRHKPYDTESTADPRLTPRIEAIGVHHNEAIALPPPSHSFVHLPPSLPECTLNLYPIIRSP
jgi:hypothetical protein